jgi:hypothetical protein
MLGGSQQASGTQPPGDEEGTAGDEEELLQLTLAPLQELSLGGFGGANSRGESTAAGAAGRAKGGAGAFGGGAAEVGGSQQSSQQAAAAWEAVRAHVAARVTKAGQVDKMDVAAKFCSVRRGLLIAGSWSSSSPRASTLTPTLTPQTPTPNRPPPPGQPRCPGPDL